MKGLLRTLSTAAFTAMLLSSTTYGQSCDLIQDSYQNLTCRTNKSLRYTQSTNYDTFSVNGTIKVTLMEAAKKVGYGSETLATILLPKNNEGETPDIVSQINVDEWVKQSRLLISSNNNSDFNTIEDSQIIMAALEMLNETNPNSETKKALTNGLFQFMTEMIHEDRTAIKGIFQELKKTPIEKQVKEIVYQAIRKSQANSLSSALMVDPETAKLRKELEDLRALPETEENKNKITQVEASLEQRKLKLQQVYDHKNFQNSLQEARYALVIGTSLLGLKDPKMAKLINDIGNASITMISNLDKIMQPGAAMASLGPYAAMTTAGLQILNAFSDQKSPHQVILEELAKLSEQIFEMRKEMHERFDQIEEILGGMRKDFMYQFSLIHKYAHDQRQLSHQIRLLAKRNSDKIDTIGLKIDSYNRENRSIQFKRIINSCIKSRSRFSDRQKALPKVVHDQCISDLDHSINDVSHLQTFKGLVGIENNVTTLANELTKNAQDYHNLIGPLSAWSANNGYTATYNLPNPTIWMISTEAYLTVREDNQIYSENTDPYGLELETIRNAAIDIDQYIQELSQNDTLFTDLTTQYKYEHQNMYNKFFDFFKTALQRSYYDRLAKTIEVENLKKVDEIKKINEDITKEKKRIDVKISLIFRDAPNMEPKPGTIERLVDFTEIKRLRKLLKSKEDQIETANKRIEKIQKMTALELFNDFMFLEMEAEKKSAIKLVCFNTTIANLEATPFDGLDLYSHLTKAYAQLGLNTYMNTDYELMKALKTKRGLKDKNQFIEFLKYKLDNGLSVDKVAEVKKQDEANVESSIKHLLEIVNKGEDQPRHHIIDSTLKRIEKFTSKMDYL